MKKKYQKPQCEIIKMQTEGTIFAGSNKISQDTTPSTPGVTKTNFFNLK